MYGIVPAAGSGSRMGSLTENKAKILLSIADTEGQDPTTGQCSVLGLTLRALASSEVLKGLVLVCRPDDQESIKRLAEHNCPNLELLFAAGGETRQESVAAGLKALEGKAEYVLVHDAARPFCPVELIQQVAATGREFGAALLAVRVKSTLKQVGDDGVIEQTVPRAAMWEAQTPQVFSYDLLAKAHHKAASDDYMGTDDCELVERIGHSVRVVEGSERNIKITTPHDLQLAKLLLQPELLA